MSQLRRQTLHSAITQAALVCLVSQAGFAQVTVGYNTLTSASGAAIVNQGYRQRTTDQYEIYGSNVEPSDGGYIFDRQTTWKVKDQSQPWSLSIVDNNPTVDVSKESTSTKLVQAGRRESVYSVVGGPLYSVIERRTFSPFASTQFPAIVPVSTTVFPEDLGKVPTSTSP